MGLFFFLVFATKNLYTYVEKIQSKERRNIGMQKARAFSLSWGVLGEMMAAVCSIYIYSNTLADGLPFRTNEFNLFFPISVDDYLPVGK